MSEHTGFHNKEHYNPDCPACNGPDRERKTALLHIVLEANKDIVQASPNTWAFNLRGINKILALFPNELQFNPDYLDFKKGVKATEEIWQVKVEEAKREERERIITHLDKLCKYNPIRTQALRRELGKYVQSLKAD